MTLIIYPSNNVTSVIKNEILTKAVKIYLNLTKTNPLQYWRGETKCLSPTLNHQVFGRIPQEVETSQVHTQCVISSYTIVVAVTAMD